MDRMEVQRDVRGAIAMAYELSRHEHVQHKEHVARALGELKDELARIEAKLGGERVGEVSADGLPSVLRHVQGLVDDAGTVVGDQIKALLRSVERIAGDITASRPGPPS
ncbi:uncharacterized protein SOCEGT47_059390 [Sorangium cellulosum]|uniref:Uncharacterized protein n=1 Tax=Sorangium cellulosum TaxID=56 RepID=A0A4P2Q7A1_SORCE|nr:hypothetical protein [Sorangium cellulosum]AUX25394.1 uncharacterized protein SOCEGT47_059390 [Sorangium cellulosum]